MQIICIKCQDLFDAKLDIHEIPLYQSVMQYIYLNPIEPAHEIILLVKTMHKKSVYIPRQRMLNFSNEDYLGLVLNRDALIVFNEFLKLDDLEALDHFQTLYIIELRDVDML